MLQVAEVRLFVAHVFVLASSVQTKGQLVQRCKGVEYGAGRFWRDLRGNWDAVDCGTQQARVGFGENALHCAEVAELMAHAGGQKAQRARPKRLLRAVVRIDLAQGLRGCGSAHCYPKISGGNHFFKH